MMTVRATVKGEPDVPAFTKVFEYGTADEEIFFSSAAMVGEKLRCGMKLNTNEALIMYCSHAVKSIRDSKSDQSIQHDASILLGAEDAMIGVRETLRQITLDVRVDNKPARTITLKEPIAEIKSPPAH